jgi:hypothetical protein
MSETPTISCETFLKLHALCDGDCSKFIKFDSKWNSNKKGNAHYNNMSIKTKGMWVPFYLKFTDEHMAFWIAALTDEDASKQTTDLGVKKPISSRKSSISQKASIQIPLYNDRLDIDPKTGKLSDPNTLPSEDKKSKLVQVISIIEKYRDEVYTQRIESKLIVDNVREIIPNHSFKVSSKKLCPMVQRFYGDKSPLAGQELINPAVRVNMQFLDSGMAPKETYYKNNILSEQKIENKTLKNNNKHYNPIPYTFANPDNTVEPISDFNVHRIPMSSVVTLGIVKMAVCSSSQGISIPMSFYKLVITEGERSKISISNVYSDSEDEEDEELKDNTVAVATTTTSEDDEPNLDGLMDE